jgi:hypothetical protein
MADHVGRERELLFQGSVWPTPTYETHESTKYLLPRITEVCREGIKRASTLRRVPVGVADREP